MLANLFLVLALATSSTLAASGLNKRLLGIGEGGTCAIGSAYSQAEGRCVNLLTDSLNCGTVGQSCQTDNGLSVCLLGQCIVSSCDEGFSLLTGACTPTGDTCPLGAVYNAEKNQCSNLLLDSLNCGARDRVCHTDNGLSLCIAGVCVISSCDDGFQLLNGGCRLPASQAARLKRRAAQPICPSGETACPLASSTSLSAQQAAAFRYGDAFTLNEVGYECIDTATNLESCGACATMGEGEDCTAIPHATSVGCSTTCVVYACEDGYEPDKPASSCIRSSTFTTKRSPKHARAIAFAHK